MNDIPAKVKVVFADFLSIEEGEITLESSIKDDLGVDSVDIVSLVGELEGEFSIKIKDAEAAGFKTIGQIVEFIHSRIV